MNKKKVFLKGKFFICKLSEKKNLFNNIYKLNNQNEMLVKEYNKN